MNDMNELNFLSTFQIEWQIIYDEEEMFYCIIKENEEE